MNFLIERSVASSCLDIVKMKEFVPCEVKDHLTPFKCKIVDVVFEPLNIEKVNNKFKDDGYIINDGLHVIAVNEDGSILLWGGLNSVYHLKKGEQITVAFDNIAFEDLLHLTRQFKIKNKKVEIDELLTQLKKTYGKTK